MSAAVPEWLKTEIDHASQAELDSDDQIRRLTALIDRVTSPDPQSPPSMNATDCSKLVAAALAVNERLRERSNSLQTAVRLAEAQTDMQALLKATAKAKAKT